jgi:hypothetical protein
VWAGVDAQTTALGLYHVKHLDIATAHLNEAVVQTAILTEIAANTSGLATYSAQINTDLARQTALDTTRRGG